MDTLPTSLVGLIQEFASFRVAEHSRTKEYTNLWDMEVHYQDCWEMMRSEVDACKWCKGGDYFLWLYPDFESFFLGVINEHHQAFCRKHFCCRAKCGQLVIRRDHFGMLPPLMRFSLVDTCAYSEGVLAGWAEEMAARYRHRFSDVFIDLLRADYSDLRGGVVQGGA